MNHSCFVWLDHSPDHVWTPGQNHQSSDDQYQGGSHQAGEGQDEGVCSAGRKIRGQW